MNSIMLPFYFIRTDSEEAIFSSHTYNEVASITSLLMSNQLKKIHPNKPFLCKPRNAPPGSWNCSLEVIYPSDYYSEYQLILQNLLKVRYFPLLIFHMNFLQEEH